WGLHSRDHDDAYCAPAPPKTQKQSGILLLAPDDELAGGGDDVTGAEIVDRRAELAQEVADAAAQGQPGAPGVADDPAGDREAEDLALAVDVLVEAATLDPDGLRQRVDARPGHERQVD